MSSKKSQQWTMKNFYQTVFEKQADDENAMHEHFPQIFKKAFKGSFGDFADQMEPFRHRIGHRLLDDFTGKKPQDKGTKRPLLKAYPIQMLPEMHQRREFLVTENNIEIVDLTQDDLPPSKKFAGPPIFDTNSIEIENVSIRSRSYSSFVPEDLGVAILKSEKTPPTYKRINPAPAPLRRISAFSSHFDFRRRRPRSPSPLTFKDDDEKRIKALEKKMSEKSVAKKIFKRNNKTYKKITFKSQLMKLKKIGSLKQSKNMENISPNKNKEQIMMSPPTPPMSPEKMEFENRTPEKSPQSTFMSSLDLRRNFTINWSKNSKVIQKLAMTEEIQHKKQLLCHEEAKQSPTKKHCI